MAKLSVVVPSNEVEVEGAKYRKVDRKAQAGDIVKVLVDDYIDVEMGAYYAVINKAGETGFYDNDGDFRDDTVQYYPKDFEVYEKVTEQAAVEYREVKRVAEVGERIRIVAAAHAYGTYENGEEFTVTSLHGHGGGVRINRKWRTQKNTDAWVLHEEYVVLEPVNVAEPAPQPERLKVGEYARVIEPNDNYNDYEIGTIVKLTRYEDRGSKHLFKAEKPDGTTGNWLRDYQLVRATEAEVESAKKAAERAKNIGEFADGGYAVVKSDADGYLSGGYRGAYVKVRPTLTEGPYALEISLSEQRGYSAYCNADALRKVTREEYEEATKPKPMFNAGDKVRLISGGGTPGFLSTYKNGIIYTVSDPKSGGEYVQIEGGVFAHGYAKPEQLEKVSAEEVARIEEEAKWAAIGRKVGEFKAGDIVEITKDLTHAGVKTGEVHTVKSPELGALGSDGVHLNTRNPYGSNAWVACEHLKLIVPVEQRFDRAEGGASRKEGEVLSK